MIYLVSAQSHNFKNVKNLKLAKINFKKIDVNLNDFEALIISSKNALKALSKSKCKLNLKIELFVLGKKSFDEAKKLGFKNIKISKKSYLKELVDEFKKDLEGKKILYLRAKKISYDIAKNSKDLNIKEIIAYETNYKKVPEGFVVQRPATFIFSSFELANNFLKQCKLKDEDKIVAIGNSTALRLKGFKNLFISNKQNVRECVKLAREIENAIS